MNQFLFWLIGNAASAVAAMLLAPQLWPLALINAFLAGIAACAFLVKRQDDAS